MTEAETRHHTPSRFLDSSPLAPGSPPVAWPSMVEDAAPTHNADARWAEFPSEDYWNRNYKTLLAPDKKMLQLVSAFFSRICPMQPRVKRAIDVGSGTNLYPALLMLPWVDQILLTDYSESNVRWLRGQVMGGEWTWEPFWRELQPLKGYNQISEPRKQLRAACTSGRGQAAIEKASVFELPTAQWQLGTMFFVAESITEDPEEFAKAIESFVGALEPHSPFAAAFMSGSNGWTLGDGDEVTYPALPVSAQDILDRFTRLRVKGLRLENVQASDLVRDGYEGMIVATGITGHR
jgi:NNMT/PNMT/TEMT family